MDLYVIEIPRREEFAISRGVSRSVTQVLVNLTGTQTDGWGAASPNSVSGETVKSITDSMMRAWEDVKKRELDIGGIESALETHAARSPAATAALSMASWDLYGRAEDLPVHALLAPGKADVLTDYSLGLGGLEQTVARAEAAASRGFGAFKIKVGVDAALDAAKVRALRARFPRARLWVDGNQGFDAAALERFVKEIGGCGVEFVEEPTARLEDAQAARTSLPLCADESVRTPEDAERVAASGLADMMNIKVMKAGTLSRAWKIASVMKRHSLIGMVGCFGETAVSIAAGLHLALAAEPIKVTDLDSPFMLVDDIAVGLPFENGKYHATRHPGLGVEVVEKKLMNYVAGGEGREASI
jgi:L-alanine-DL-glutamate epimerase-like enolase superfamily enzyme